MRSKFNIPLPLKPVIKRERLYKRLDASQSQCIAVCGTAGSGKTSLISSWIHSKKVPGAWLTLDRTDNSAAQVMDSIAGSIEHNRGISLASFKALSAAAAENQSDINSIELAAALITDIEQAEVDIIIILDDYHCVKSTDVNEAVRFILHHLPDNLKIIISSRSSLPFPVTRLKASGKMDVIGSDDLAFTVSETVELLQNNGGLSEDQQKFKDIHERTGGWAIALQLSELYLRNIEEDTLYREGYDRQELSAFLMEEIFSELEPALRYELLRIAPADEFSPELIDFIFSVPRDDSSLKPLRSYNFIDSITDKNLFLNCIDQTAPSYKFHDFFREFLLHELKKEDPVEEKRIFSLICDWYNLHREPENALEYAFRAADSSRISSTIEEVVKNNSDNRIIFRYERWLDNPAVTASAAAPEVHLHKARIHLHKGEINRVFEHLAAAEKTAGLSANEKSTTARITAMRAAIALFGGRHNEVIDLCSRTLNLIGKDSRLYSLCKTYYAISALQSGQIELGETIKILAEAETAGAESGNWLQSYSAGFQKAVFMYRANQIDEAYEDHCRRINELESRKLPYYGILGNSYSEKGCLTDILYPDRDSLSLVDKGCEIAQASCSTTSIWWSMYSRLRVLCKNSDRETVSRAFRQLHGFEQEHTIPPWFPELSKTLFDNHEKNREPDCLVSDPETTETTAYIEDLSQRELEVLHCLSEGYSNFQISEELFISMNTVKTHLKNINGKLGAENRTRAVHIARRLKLL